MRVAAVSLPRRPPRRCRVTIWWPVLAVLCVTAAFTLGAPSIASAHFCGRADGVKIHAYNLSCEKARSIFGGQPPKGWTAGNVDVAGGVAVYYRTVDEEAVTKAIDPHAGRVHVGRLHGAPLIIAAEPYGEDRRLNLTTPPLAREMRTPDYRSCVPSEPALAMVADLHRVSFRTACRVTKKITSYPWAESEVRTRVVRAEHSRDAWGQSMHLALGGGR